MKEKQKAVKATQEETHEPRTVAHSQHFYKRSIKAINRPGKNNEQLNAKFYEKQQKIREDDRTKPN